MDLKYQNPKDTPEPKVGDLRVWWNPQIGSKVPHIYFPVPTVHEGVRLMDALARYDLFQLEHNVKPDFANVGGLEVYAAETFCVEFCPTGSAPGWQSWEHESDEEYFDDPAQFVAKYPLEDAFHDQLYAAKVILHTDTTGEDGQQLRVGATTGVGSDMQILLEPIETDCN